MNGHLWREFYLTAHNPVFEDGQSYVDLTLFSHEKYPALKLLKSHSPLEILLLGQLILQAEWDDPEDQYCSEALLMELFENYDCTEEAIHQALGRLEAKNWVEMFVELSDGSLHFKAIISQLILDGIYTENQWRHLYQLGLYSSRLCSN